MSDPQKTIEGGTLRARNKFRWNTILSPGFEHAWITRFMIVRTEVWNEHRSCSWLENTSRVVPLKISDHCLAICKTENNSSLSSTTNDGHAQLLITIYESEFASSPVFFADQHYVLRYTLDHSGEEWEAGGGSEWRERSRFSRGFSNFQF